MTARTLAVFTGTYICSQITSFPDKPGQVVFAWFPSAALSTKKTVRSVTMNSWRHPQKAKKQQAKQKSQGEENDTD